MPADPVAVSEGPDLAEIATHHVDGVPVFHLRRPGDTVAALVFGVGTADEELPNKGITHFVEHLALSQPERPTFTYNAQVTLRFTRFVAQVSKPGDVSAFMRFVGRGLAELEDRDVDRERRILLTEDAQRTAGPIDICLHEWFGARGPGISGYDELGLNHLNATDIAGWRDQRFTAANAAIWIVGTLPDDLALELDTGVAPERRLPEMRDVDLPAFKAVAGNRVGLSVIGERSWRFAVAMRLLEERSTDRLRHDLGLSYGVVSAGDHLSRDSSFGMLLADGLPENLDHVGEALLAVADGLATEPPSLDELTASVDRFVEMIASTSAEPARADSRATSHLDRRDALGLVGQLAELRAVSPEDVRRTVASLLARALVLAPSHLPSLHGRFEPVPVWSADRVVGRVLRSLWRGGDRYPALVVATDGITWEVSASKAVTVRFGACAAALEWNDDQVTLIGEDGLSLRLDPGEWPDGARVRDDVLAAIDPSVRIRLDRAGPARAPGAKRRWWNRAIGRRLTSAWTPFFIVGVIGLNMLNGSNGSNNAPLGTAFIVAAVVGAVVQSVRRGRPKAKAGRRQRTS